MKRGQMSEGKSKIKIVFVCAPGLPPLDMWLPVLNSLRKSLKEAEFIFLAPKTGPIRQLDLSEILHKIAGPLFDAVIFPTNSGSWKQARSLQEAKRMIEGGVLSTGARILKRAGLAAILRGPRKIAQRIVKRFLRTKTPNSCPLRALSAENGVVLFDLFSADIAYVRDAIVHLEHMPKFSMLHGINVLGLNPQEMRPASSSLPGKTTALLFSEREFDFYRKIYGLQDQSMRVVGIPRHDENWIRFLSSLCDENPTINKKFVFVISRGSDPRYFPKELKIAALRDVQEAARAHGLHVVVKRHPKEADDEPYEEVFGRENLGKTWTFSNTHPIILGLRCEFAVTFYSGVAIDMVRLGTPVIERFDASINAKDFLLGSVEQPPGVLLSPYNHLGLVHSARTQDQFMKLVDRVLRDKVGECRAMVQNYQKIFPTTENVSEKIASEIISSLNV